MSLPLKDKWIVVTRPSHQSTPIETKLRLAGANVILFPLLAIDSPTNKSLAKQQLSEIAKYDLVIFVSANAVKQSIKLIDTNKFSQLRIAAIGKKTVQQLKAHKLSVAVFPESIFNSEALLLLDEIKTLNTKNSVAIIRGEGGRDLLKTRLQAQGVKVVYINVYKQFCPQKTLETLSYYQKQNKLDIILLTSGNSATNLFNLQKSKTDEHWLNTAPLMAGSKRIKQKIKTTTSHTGEIQEAEDPSDETLFQQLVYWAEKGKQSKQ